MCFKTWFIYSNKLELAPLLSRGSFGPSALNLPEIDEISNWT